MATPNRNYPQPDPATAVSVDVYTLINALLAIDIDMRDVFLALAGKAASDHDHALEDVAGLVSALGDKMSATFHDTLGGLSNVDDGANGAPSGSILVRGSNALWTVGNPATILGAHTHVVGQITGLADVLAARLRLDASQSFSAAQQAQGRTNLGLIDGWGAQPVGAIIPLLDSLAGVAAPPTDVAYRYIKLTAADAYNSGVLTSETISGSAPAVSATALINLAGSPLNGLTIRLINTERRFLRAGAAGTIEDSANLTHTHTGTTSSDSHNHTGTTSSYTHGHSYERPEEAIVVQSGTGKDVWDNTYGGQSTTDNTHSHTFTTSSDAHAHTFTTAANGGTEARPRNIGVTYFMRVK